MQRLVLVGWFAMALAAFGCAGGGGGGLARDGGAAFDTGPPPPPCDADEDADGDGIADALEGETDPDGDGIPSRLDDDSDGDGVLDAEEARSDDPCRPADSDRDGLIDALDPDSDNDGLSDAAEADLGTNPTEIDSDGDGVTDLGEVEGAGTDPNDAGSTIPEGDFFVVLPYEGTRENRDLTFGTSIKVADLMLLVDMTASMRDERTNLIEGLSDVVIPGVRERIPDVQFGVAGLDDYPVNCYGAEAQTLASQGETYRVRQDLPFYLLRPVAPFDQDLGAWSIAGASSTACPIDDDVADVGRIQGSPNGRPDLLEAVEGLPCHGGMDIPESYVPALWATATGASLSWSAGSATCRINVIPPGGTPDDLESRDVTMTWAADATPAAACADGHVGAACFRPGALPIVLMVGDAPFHDGPGAANAYADLLDSPTYNTTRDALVDIGARVMSVFSGNPESAAGQMALAHYGFVGRDTGTVRADGEPLVFQIDSDGSGLSAVIVDAVEELVGGTPQDVNTRQENVPGNPDEFDATRFIEAVRPLSADPSDGIAGMTGTTFRGVIPGTDVTFAIDFYNDVRPPADVAQIFKANIVVVGNGVTDLDSRNVYIVVPPAGEIILI